MSEVFGIRVPFSALTQAPLFVVPLGLLARRVSLNDISGLFSLKRQWLRASRHTRLADGFLSTEYSTVEFQVLISASEVAVLECLSRCARPN